MNYLGMQLVWIVLSALLSVLPVRAAVVTEGFEYTDMTALAAAGWESAGSTIDLVSSTSQGAAPHSGSKMLRLTYDNYPYDANGQLLETNNAKITKTFTAIANLYERYWVRYECIPARSGCSFSLPSALSNGGQKQHYYNVAELPSTFAAAGRLGSTRYNLSNQSNVSHLCPNGSTDVTCNFDPNVGNVALTFNAWHCIETHLGPNIHEAWVDGTQVISSDRVVSPATWHTMQIYRQAGEYMYRYEDDLVIDTARVGCGGATPPPTDTTPPTQVTGASASATSSTSIVISHAGASDAGGIGAYSYQRCQGAACTNFSTVAQNTALSYADTGLSAATLYRYRVQAQDVAGNLGAVSAIVETTTLATSSTLTRRQLFIDPITRTDSADLGTGWDAGYTGSSAMTVVSNAIQGSTLAAVHMESENTVTWPADQWVQAQLVAYTNGLSGGGPACRMANPPTANAYWVDTNGSNKYVIRRRTAGVDVTIATSTVDAVSNGVLRLECVGANQTLYLNGTAIASAADADFATGRVGIMLYVATSLSNTIFDNVVAGDYTTTAIPTIATAVPSVTGAILTYGATTPATVRVQVFGSVASDTVVPGALFVPVATQQFSDTFTRANGALGSPWDAGGTLTIVSNRAQAPAGAVGVSAFYESHTSTTLTNDQRVSVTLPQWTSTNQHFLDLDVRFDTVLGNGYSCEMNNTSGTNFVRIQRWDAYGTTDLNPEGSTIVTLTGNDTFTCDAIGPGIFMFQNGTLVKYAFDTTYPSGQAGVKTAIPAGGNGNDVAVDNFVVSNLASPYTYARTWVPGNSSVCFIPRDPNGAESLGSSDYQCVSLAAIVSSDVTPPVISNGAPTTTLAAGTTSITESVTTDELARCRRSTTDQAYSAMTQDMTTLNGISHSYTATGLANNTSYTTYVRCTDQLNTDLPTPNNPNTSSYSFSYSVAAAGGDTTAPSTVAGLSCSAFSTSQINCSFTAATDNTAVTGYEAYLCDDSVCTTPSLFASWGTGSVQSLTGLGAGTQYRIAVKAFDAAGNRSAAVSNVVTVTTQAALDVVPPSTMTNLRVDGTYTNSVVLTWDQGTDERGPVTVLIEQAPAGCTAWNQVVSQLALSKLAVDLQPTTGYCFRGKFADSSGNLSTAWSNTLTLTTTSTGLRQPRLPLAFGQERTAAGGTRLVK